MTSLFTSQFLIIIFYKLVHFQFQEIVVSGQDGQLIVRNGDLYGRKSGSVKEDVLLVDAEDFPNGQLKHPHLPQLYLKGWRRALRHLVSWSHKEIDQGMLTEVERWVQLTFLHQHV